MEEPGYQGKIYKNSSSCFDHMTGNVNPANKIYSVIKSERQKSRESSLKKKSVERKKRVITRRTSKDLIASHYNHWNHRSKPKNIAKDAPRPAFNYHRRTSREQFKSKNFPYERERDYKQKNYSPQPSRRNEDDKYDILSNKPLRSHRRASQSDVNSIQDSYVASTDNLWRNESSRSLRRNSSKDYSLRSVNGDRVGSLILRVDTIPRDSPKKSYKAINKNKVIGRYEVKASPKKKPPRPLRRSRGNLRSPSARNNQSSAPGTPRSISRTSRRSASRARSTSKDNISIQAKMERRTLDSERMLVRDLQRQGLHITNVKAQINPITGQAVGDLQFEVKGVDGVIQKEAVEILNSKGLKASLPKKKKRRNRPKIIKFKPSEKKE